MLRRLILLSAFVTLGLPSPAGAADLAAGKAKVMIVCADCHGLTGMSVVDNFPNLAGQKEMYLISQLKAFKAGTRKNMEMNLIAKQLSEADMANVSVYFAGPTQPAKGTVK